MVSGLLVTGVRGPGLILEHLDIEGFFIRSRLRPPTPTEKEHTNQDQQLRTDHVPARPNQSQQHIILAARYDATGVRQRGGEAFGHHQPPDAGGDERLRSRERLRL